MKFSVKWIGSDVVISLNGIVDYNDLTLADGELFGDPRFDNANYMIANFMDVDELALSEQEIKFKAELNTSAGSWKRGFKLAVVVEKPNVKDITLAYFEFMKNSGWELECFESVAEAKEWVEIPRKTIEKSLLPEINENY